MEEIWKDIEGYDGYFQISNLGRVRDRNGNIKSTYINNKGYHCLSLHNKKTHKTDHPTVHRLVAMHFLSNPNNYAQVNHIDCDKNNNCVSNLEWCDQRRNYDEGMKHFLYSHNEDHYFAKLTNEVVKIIPRLYEIGFIRATIARILGINHSTLEAIENGVSYRELNLNWNVHRCKYKDIPNIKIPSDVWEVLKDNTVLNTMIAQGIVSV